MNYLLSQVTAVSLPLTMLLAMEIIRRDLSMKVQKVHRYIIKCRGSQGSE